MDKLMQLIGIVLLYLAGLSGSEYIYGKKRALTIFTVRQRGRVCKGERNEVMRKGGIYTLIAPSRPLSPPTHTLGYPSGFTRLPAVTTLLPGTNRYSQKKSGAVLLRSCSLKNE